jgi:hypothetical protein
MRHVQVGRLALLFAMSAGCNQACGIDEPVSWDVGAVVCPRGVPTVFSIVGPTSPDAAWDTAAPGCASGGTETLVAEAQIEAGTTVLRIDFRRESDMPFSSGELFQLFEGDPSCSSFPQTNLTHKVSQNSAQGFIEYALDPNDPTWPIGTTRTFWVGEELDGGTAARGTGAVTVEKGCCTPVVVSSVEPLTAPFCGLTTFTVSGQCLPDTLAFYVQQCANPVPVPESHSLTQAQFTCTPCPCFVDGCDNAAPMTGLVKDYACTQGTPPPTTLMPFQVSFEPADAGGAGCTCPTVTMPDPCNDI